MESDNTNDDNTSILQKTVLVSNLPLIYDKSDIHALFANVGKIVNCSLHKNETGTHKIALIEFSSPKEADVAVNLSGVSVRRHFLKIQHSKCPVLSNEFAENDSLSSDLMDKMSKVYEAMEKISSKLSIKGTHGSELSEPPDSTPSEVKEPNKRKTTRFDCKEHNSTRPVNDQHP